MKIIMIRHAATMGNLEKRYIGKTDEPITEEARQSCHALQAAFLQLIEKEEGTWMYALSPMKRCVETFEALCGQSVEAIGGILEPDFRECDFGLFEGKNYHELQKQEAYKKWIDSGGSLDFPQGESIGNFKKRCIEAFLDLVKQAQEDNVGICMVVHGGTIMALGERFGWPQRTYYDYQIKNLQWKSFQWDGKHLIED